MVLLSMLRFAMLVPLPAPLNMPPPRLLALFPVTVLFLIKTVTVPFSVTLLLMPPPLPLLFPEMVLLAIAKTPEFERPPPEPAAVFPETMALVSVNWPEFEIPPPKPAARVPAALPREIVKPEIATDLAELIVNTRKFPVPGAVLRCTVRRPGPGPMMLTLWFILGSALAKLIAPVTPLKSITIGPHEACEFAVSIAARSVHTPPAVAHTASLGAASPESPVSFTTSVTGQSSLVIVPVAELGLATL